MGRKSVMKKIKLILTICVFTLLTTACNQQRDKKDENWQVDEVLSHLSELRKEVAALRGEVKTLSEKMDKLKAGPRKRGVPAMPLGSQKPLGDDKAEYAIVEFSDYQCPFCVRHAKKVYPQLKKNYVETGKVKYYVRNFPLSFHAQAKNAAIVAECAGKQGKQWPVHEYLFDNMRQFNDKFFAGVAREFQLDETKFENCRKDKKIAAKVDADMLLGQKMGVSGTPKFFVGKIKNNQLVNVVPLNGAQPYKAFEQVLNSFDKK